MSKERKFHQLIESQNQEEKARVWSKIQEKMDTTAETEPIVVKEVTRNAKLNWNWRKWIAVATATAAIICLSVFAVVKFLPNGDIIASDSSSGNTQVETSESDSQNENRYCTAEEYTSSATVKTIKQYAQEIGKDILYFDWYEITEEVTNSVYQLNKTQEIVCYRENIINPETGDFLTLYVTEKSTQMDFLDDLCGPNQEISNYNQVEISWSTGLAKGYASFEYGGYKYNIELTEPLEEDDVLEYAKLLLS